MKTFVVLLFPKDVREILNFVEPERVCAKARASASPI